MMIDDSFVVGCFLGKSESVTHLIRVPVTYPSLCIYEEAFMQTSDSTLDSTSDAYFRQSSGKA